MKPYRVFIFIIILLLVPSCAGPLSLERSDSTVDPLVGQDDILTASITLSPTALPSPTSSPIPTLTPTSTPTRTATPPILNQFSYPSLNMGIKTVSYKDDACDYLQNRWDEGKSKPGTIVVPIMFHSVAKPGREITDATTISMEFFEYFMLKAKDLGFTTITVEQLIGFLNQNKKIPERSMLLILDDRRPGVTELFMPFLEENNWTLTLAWPTTDATYDALWERMEELAESGLLDVQSHGHDHIYIQEYTPIEEVEEEIYKPIGIIEKHFGTTPQALIWPGGNFTEEAVTIAREAGFKLGFTVYSRGPLMFNWIPQGEEESTVSDSLMVLPRYWSIEGVIALEKALEISEAARLDAESVRDAELRYWETYCQSYSGE